MSRSRLLLLACLLAAALLVGCVPTGRVSGGGAEGPLVVVLGTPPSTLIPYSANLAARQVGSLVFQSLVSIDASGSPVPDLALEVPTRANGGVSADGKSVTFRLDPEARWHDGKPVTADDVVFTCGLLQSGELQTGAPATWRRLRSVKTLDERTVLMEFAEADIPGALMLVPFVLPEHLLGDSEDLIADPYWDKPIGSGPYGVASVTRRRSVTLDRMGDDGLEQLRCVFHEDAASMRKTWDSARRAVWPGAELQPVGAERVVSGPSRSARYYLLNCAPGHITADVSVRRAIAAGIVSGDSEESTATIFGATAIPRLRGAQIADALAKAGWRTSADGVRRRQGESLGIDLVYQPESEQDGYHMGEVAVALRDVGFDVRVQATVDYGDYYDPRSTPVWGTWDVVRVIAPEGAPYGYAWPFEASDVPSFENPSGLNVARIADSELERLMAEMRATDDPEQLAGLRSAFGARLEELAVVLPDRSLDARTLYRGVEGVSAYAAEVDAIRGATQWHVRGGGE